MFDKRPREWTAEDVRKVATGQPPESDQLELKRAVPAKGNEPDRWVTHGDRIGDRGRNDLLATMVGFANAHGGWLLIGINETRTKPPKAESIVPVPECADLAERLRGAARECIDPPLPVLEIEGVATEKDGSGVVVCHVPRSRAAAHRLSPDRHCYIRRGPSTEVMRSMRDIQDLTLNTVRGLEEVKAKLAARREAFGKLFGVVGDGGVVKRGIRASLVPTTPLFVERVHNVDEVRPPAIVTRARYEGHSTYFDAATPSQFGLWRPILRGTRSEMTTERAIGAIEICCDGTIEYHVVRTPRGDSREFHLGWLIGWVANALCAAAKFRQAASAPGVEYALQVEVAVTGDEPLIIPFGGSAADVYGRYPIGNLPFPDYSVRSLEEFSDIVAWVARDFWNTAGIEEHAKLHLDFERAFRDAGIGP